MKWEYKAVMLFLTLLIFCVGSVCATEPNNTTGGEYRGVYDDPVVTFYYELPKDAPKLDYLSDEYLTTEHYDKEYINWMKGQRAYENSNAHEINKKYPELYFKGDISPMLAYMTHNPDLNNLNKNETNVSERLTNLAVNRIPITLSAAGMVCAERLTSNSKSISEISWLKSKIGEFAHEKIVIENQKRALEDHINQIQDLKSSNDLKQVCNSELNLYDVKNKVYMLKQQMDATLLYENDNINLERQALKEVLNNRLDMHNTATEMTDIIGENSGMGGSDELNKMKTDGSTQLLEDYDNKINEINNAAKPSIQQLKNIQKVVNAGCSVFIQAGLVMYMTVLTAMNFLAVCVGHTSTFLKNWEPASNCPVEYYQYYVDFMNHKHVLTDNFE